MEEKIELSSIQQALYTVNRHAKTATHSSELYTLKSKSLNKLIEDNLAKKEYIEFSQNPSKGLQSSVVVVKVGTPKSKDIYYFHTIPEKEDFKHLKHRGEMKHDMKNPHFHMGLNKAKSILYSYIKEAPPKVMTNQRPKRKQAPKNKHIFTSSFLDGKRY